MFKIEHNIQIILFVDIVLPVGYIIEKKGQRYMRRPLILMIGSGDSIPNCKPEDITIYGPFNSVKEAMKIVRDMFDGAPFSIKTARANKLFIIESLNKTGKPLTGI